MDLDLITPDAVHETLRAIRQAKPLGDSRLLGVGALRARLHAEGRSDSPAGRESV
jgi:hypothetical protein